MKVIHCLHEQKPSVFFQFSKKLSNYIEYRHAEDPEFPDNKSIVELALRCKFVHNKGEPMDEDRHFLFKSWRNAIYCEGDKECVKQLVMFLDGFVHWYSCLTDAGQEEFPTTPKLDIELPVEFNIDFADAPEQDDDKEMDCEFAVSHPENPTANVFDSPPPCFPARLVVATIEPVSKNAVAIVWSGNTRPFKAEFEQQGIGGKAIKKNASDKYGEYFRKVENLPMSKSQDRDEIEALFGETLMRNGPIVVRIRGQVDEDDNFKALISTLKKKKNCYFAK
jgi:hypothetical protein